MLAHLQAHVYLRVDEVVQSNQIMKTYVAVIVAQGSRFTQ